VAAPTRTRLAAGATAAALAAGGLAATAPTASSSPLPASSSTAAAASAAGPSGYPDRPVSRLVVRMKDRAPVDLRVAAAVADAAGVDGAAQVRRTVDGAAVVALSQAVPAGQAEAAARVIAARADVEWAQPDRWMYVDSDPVPEYETKPQWNLWDSAKADGGYGARPASAWLGSRGSRSVVVAVVDTGITAHPDLDARIVPGYDFVSADDLPPGSGLNRAPLTANDGGGRDDDPSDPGDWISSTESSSFNFFRGCPTKRSSWHGTHVTGILVAQQDGSGIVGVAPDVVVQPVRAVGKCSGSESDIADAIVWAAGGSVAGVPANATPATVINLSLGGPGRCGVLMQSAVSRAVALGATVVAATGNGGGSVFYQSASDPGSFPANCSGVVSVAASSRTGRLGVDGDGTPYANTGDKAGQVTLSAPGGSQTGSLNDGIWSTVSSGSTRPGAPTYASYVGTSMAAPHVSAAAALLQSARLGSPLAPSTVKAALSKLVRPFSGGTCLTSASKPCGSGILDLSRLSPQQVVAEPRDGAVAVSWLSPAALGSTPVAAYVVDRYADGSATPVTQEVDGALTSWTDTSVVNGTSYEYVVRARIGTALTVLAERTPPVVPTAAPEPGMPQSVAATPSLAGVDLTWAPPAVGAGSVTGYVVQYRSSSTGTWSCALPLFAGQCPPVAGGAATAAYSLDLSALPTTTGEYDVRVTAGTESGLGTPSRPERMAVRGLVRTAELGSTTLRPYVDGFQDSVLVSATTTLESTAEVRISPEAGGAPVRTIVEAPATAFAALWDGTDDVGDPVAPGRYVVQVLTDDLSGTSAIDTPQPLVVTVAGSDVAAPTLTSSSPTVYWRADGFFDTVTLTATTAVPAKAVFTVRSQSGTVLWRKSTFTLSRTSSTTWSGRRSADGTVVPSGTYKLDVVVTGANGSTAQLLDRPISVSSRVLKAVKFTKTVTPDKVVVSALRGSVALTPYPYDGTTSTELRVRGGLGASGSVYDVLALSSSLPSTVAAKGYTGVKVTTCLRRSPVGTSILGTGWMSSPTAFAGWFAALVDESAGNVTVSPGTIDCRTPNIATPSVATTGGRARWTLFNWGSSRSDYVPVYRFTITGTRYTLS
jgi:serine protease